MKMKRKGKAKKSEKKLIQGVYLVSILLLSPSVIRYFSRFLDIKSLIKLKGTCTRLNNGIGSRPFTLTFSAFSKSLKYIPTFANNRLHLYLRPIHENLTEQQFLYLAKIGHLDFINLIPMASQLFPQHVFQQAFRASIRQRLGCQARICWTLVSQNQVTDLTIQNYNVLEYASIVGNPDLVEFLLKLEDEFDPSLNHHSALRQAAKRGNASCLKALLNHSKSDPSVNENEAIRESAAHGHLKCVKLLLFSGKVNCRDKNDEALVRAASAGYLLIVMNLIKYGCEASARNYQAVYQAIAHHHSETVHFLFQKCLEMKNISFCIPFVGKVEVLKNLEMCHLDHPAIQNVPRSLLIKLNTLYNHHHLKDPVNK